MSDQRPKSVRQRLFDGLRDALRDGDVEEASRLRLVLADLLEEQGRYPGQQFILRGPWALECRKGKVAPRFFCDLTGTSLPGRGDRMADFLLFAPDQTHVTVRGHRVDPVTTPKGWPAHLNLGETYRRACLRACGRWMIEHPRMCKDVFTAWNEAFLFGGFLVRRGHLWGTRGRDDLTFDELLREISRVVFKC